MTHKQLRILHSMVSFALEHRPGKPFDDEKEVAEIVRMWAITGVITNTKD